jgi:hypothetical protein
MDAGKVAIQADQIPGDRRFGKRLAAVEGPAGCRLKPQQTHSSRSSNLVIVISGPRPSSFCGCRTAWRMAASATSGRAGHRSEHAGLIVRPQRCQSYHLGHAAIGDGQPLHPLPAVCLAVCAVGPPGAAGNAACSIMRGVQRKVLAAHPF